MAESLTFFETISSDRTKTKIYKVVVLEPIMVGCTDLKVMPIYKFGELLLLECIIFIADLP